MHSFPPRVNPEKMFELEVYTESIIQELYGNQDEAPAPRAKILFISTTCPLRIVGDINIDDKLFPK